MWQLRTILAFLLAIIAGAQAKTIRVVVWDEQQAEQRKAYTNFLGNQIAAHLKAFTNLSVRSVSLADPDQGLTEETLDNCDVLIWWGHLKHGAIQEQKAREIVARIKAGKLSLIALHSAHWSEPFVQAMNERAREDAARSLRPCERVEFISPPRFQAPKTDAALTPRTETTTDDGTKLMRVTLPICCFPSWRSDGAPSHVTTLTPRHPIARDIPLRFDISQTEMYSEPFHVPAPDSVIFEEKWDKGEHFRSGCVWNVGKGKVFYFRPGHETYPVFLESNPLKILANAALWLGGEQR